MYKIFSDKVGDYLISLPQSGFPTITIKSPQFALEVMMGLQKVLREKFPCPECRGTGKKYIVYSSKDESGVFTECHTCKGTGIHIPESEA